MVISKFQKPWIVQKYGGTSLGKMIDRICGEIVPFSLDTTQVVVVCSALSSSQKMNGTTSLLLDCIELARTLGDAASSSAKIATNIASIRDNHIRILKANARGTKSPELAEVEAEIDRDCSEVQSVLTAAQRICEVSSRTADKILILGEKLAAKLVAFQLRTQNIEAEAIVFDDVVEETFGSNLQQQTTAYRKLGTRFYHELARTMAARLSSYVDVVPVVSGFFGMMPGSLLDCVGRGYSDVCAAMCASELRARELQIWKEVDGVFTADPRMVPSARLLPTVTLQEAAELTFFGSEVIHPLTMSQVQRAGVAMRVKNVLRPSSAGTVITPMERDSNAGAEAVNQQTRHRPTAISVKRNVMVANMTCSQYARPSRLLRTVFDQLEVHNASVDLVSVSEKNISIAVDEERNSDAILELVEHVEQSGQGDVVVNRGLCIVSVVGQMKNMVGVAGEMFSALAAAKINIHMISQGASEINIAAVVDGEHAVAAMEVIHAQVLKLPTVLETQNGFIRGPWLY